MNFGAIKNIHFVGVGGIGMSGIAEILVHRAFSVSGCDLKATALTQRLQTVGVEFMTGHETSHVESSDLVVTSSAVRGDNAEVLRARELGIPVMRRAELLGQLLALKQGIAVAGTHGKTTTSAMTAMVLSEGGLDPTLIVGGVLRNYATNARSGEGEYLVVEADEYDRSFLTLFPKVAVITNIEADHLDCYRDLDDIRATFGQFVSNVPREGGVVIGCVDDANVAALLKEAGRRTIGYGMSRGADLRARQLEPSEAGVSFEVVSEDVMLGTIELAVPGEHNVRNALAATAVALEVGVGFDQIAAGLRRFTGVERRFQLLGERKGALVIDDYAHHPTEIAATLQAARSSYPERRIVALFQPHLFSRTRDFAEDFARSLRVADIAIVSPIYAAREEPIEGVTSELITDAAVRSGAANVVFSPKNHESLAAEISGMLRDGDLFVTMGAGDVNRVGQMLMEERS